MDSYWAGVTSPPKRKGANNIISKDLTDELLRNVKEQQAIMKQIEEAKTKGHISIKELSRLIDKREQLKDERKTILERIEAELLTGSYR